MAFNLLSSHPLFNPPPSGRSLLHPPPSSPTSITFSRSRSHNHPTTPPPSSPTPTTTKKLHGSPISLPTQSKPRRTHPTPSHPAFRPAARGPAKIPIPATGDPVESPTGIRVTDRGLSYRLDGAPFEFQYSYTEAPRARPVALREVPFLPFGPEQTPRPWTGRKPLPKSKKELPEFDSFKLPPPGKKGVKPVQSPGPFLAGMEPRYQTSSKEEVLGEPLTKEEIADLVKGSLKTKRQLNMGRDGLTHNMLENIHTHWKRKRVCKIKCKGVCTVDLDNVCQQLEEKVGGKVIYRHGGVIFLFRGRNYNYRIRPRFPLMLWKPVAPVYPRLVQKVPDDLTLEEATEMRKRGRKLLPICKLGKNGVYTNLVKQVREAFETCDLVRVNCSGLNKSDCRKIGAKLKDLVPCVLLSFEFEHILMWRGKDWESSLPPLEEKFVEAASDQPSSVSNTHFLNDDFLDSGTAQTSNQVFSSKMPLEGSSLDEGSDKQNYSLKPDVVNDMLLSSATVVPGLYRSVDVVWNEPSAAIQLEACSLDAENNLLDPSLKLSYKNMPSYRSENRELVEGSHDQGRGSELLAGTYMYPSNTESCEVTYKLETARESIVDLVVDGRDSIKSDPSSRSTMSSYMEGVLLLLKQAIDSGRALVLDEDEFSDADVVYQKSVAFTKIAPRGPVFQHMPRRSNVRRNESDKHVKLHKQQRENKVATHTEKKIDADRGLRMQRRDEAQEFLFDVVPQGTLRVDELAKLLA